ncbi:NRDE family protein [Parahaliea maris]|uniref:NRDE family protein n=1 Tax=Parahaliea maris TaxID=2716870 RepID=A0A5C9A1X4_9GAMM|nr:NRDE family protein [Parahaliea maris]TXS93942.1 NRDE family protein [Parahaliea maris]
MCLIIFAYRVHPEFPLLMAANRDEFHRRPTAATQFWPELPQLLAGRDLQAGGTWMGITRQGRFAAITNFRDPSRSAAAPRSRGELPIAWLEGREAPAPWLESRLAAADQYAGFNLLFGDRSGLWYWSNAGDRGRRPLEPGIYGLSNASLDTPWPKALLGKARLEKVLEQEISHEALLDTVQDRSLAEPEDLHPLELREAMDRQLSAQFIRTPEYGTRSSTTLTWSEDDRVSWQEHSYDAGGRELEVRREEFGLESPAD